ncbi:MAG: helix-turn-helix domain-containing protein [Candidatus Odinarchaeia archaeon]
MSVKDIFNQLIMPEFDLKCVASCTLGLQETEMETYITLLKNGPLTVQQLAKKINKSRPTAQRILMQLMSKEIVYRRKYPYLNGGYTYIYEAIPLEDMKKKIIERIKKWCSKAIKVIEKYVI